MRIRQLEYFVTAVESGSFVAAAKKLYVTPQTISKAVVELERELGVDLFQKTKRESQTTDIGMSVYKTSLNLLDNLEQISDLATAFSHDALNKNNVALAIATSPNRGIDVTAEQMQKVQECCPETTIEFLFDSNGACFASMEDDIVDAAIVLGKVEKPGLKHKKIYSYRLAIALSPNHPLASKRSLKLVDIKSFEIVAPSDIFYCYPTIKRRLEDQGIRPRFRHIPCGLESNHLMKSKSVMFVAYREAAPTNPPGCVVVPLDESDRIEIGVFFIEKEMAASLSTHRIASLFSLIAK